MATYTQEYDAALLQVPWLSKTDSASKPYLIKYARHPNKPGFIALLTDLNKVYFEPLVGIRLLARQREVEEKYGESQRTKDAGGSSLDVGGEEAVHEVLDGLDDLMGKMLGEAEMTVSSGDLYDLDVVVQCPTTSWVFHMTEIRYGSVEIITRHVVHPLALSLTSSKRPSNPTDEQIVEIVSSNVVLSAINNHSAHSKKQSAVKDTEGVNDDETRRKSRLVRRRDASRSKSHAVTPEPEPEPISSKDDPGRDSLSPTLRDGKGNNDRRAKRKSPSPALDDDEMMPDEVGSEPPSSPPKHKSPSPPEQRVKGKRKQDKEGDQNGDQDQDDDMAPEEDRAKEEPIMTEPEPSNEPLPPPSQKSQREKNEEEEEELARKREEMKRKMGAGGGGRLVRRRFGR